MGGGLMQLVAYGAQDIYLTGNPQITFFKVVYRRHTNFSMELIEQTINGTVGAGSRVTSTISRNGDLIGRMYVRFAAESIIVAASGDNPGHNLFDSVEVEIGGQRIDKHHGHYLEVNACLTEENPGTVAPAAAAAVPAAGHTKFQGMALAGGVTDAAGEVTLTDAHFVPLRFWFNRNPGLALPLIALQYHEVKIILNMSAATNTGNSTLGTNLSLWADYIYLDTDERRRFAQQSHEYLIEQVQMQEFSQGKSNELTFNHPVKELIWAGKGGQTWGAAHAGAGTFTDVAGVNWLIKLNGHDRFASQDVNYFTKSQVWAHHTGCGGKAHGASLANSIAVYSFALKPEEHQPSGTCNFSRIDTAKLESSADSSSNGIYVYAVNYNVLRIMSGMGGLAYSN
tara:strand:+ start:199 stop:1389 length:1191 start_codon:yes stop_codon:yes gene_type:complete